MKTLIVTVGVGKTIPSGILRSISDQNPDRVVFLFTKESKIKHGQELEEKTKKMGKTVGGIELSREADADRLVLECAGIIQQEVNKANKSNVSIDFTFGTKSMTAALYSAGLIVGLDKASYVEGEREPETGIVRESTERVKVMSYALPRVVLLSQRLIHLYNSYYYGGALELAEEVKRLAGMLAGMLADFGRKADALYHICRAAYSWDKFEFGKAAEEVRKLLDYAKETAYFFGITADEAVSRKCLEDMVEYLLPLQEDPMNPSLARELIRCAERRAATKRWDDAVARLYRAMEFIGQRALFDLGLFDGKEYKEPPEGGLPSEIKELLDKGVPLGLRNVYRVLFYQKHPLGNRFVEGDELVPELQESLSSRNRSILAHGFKPVGEEAYKRFREIVQKAIETAKLKEPGFTILDIKVETLL